MIFAIDSILTALHAAYHHLELVRVDYIDERAGVNRLAAIDFAMMPTDERGKPIESEKHIARVIDYRRSSRLLTVPF